MRYTTIVVDPPWPQKGGGTLKGSFGWSDSSGQSKPMPYNVMTLDQIAALPIGERAADDAHLYVWTTNKFLPETFALIAG